MTAAILPFPRPHLRLVEAVREARYRADQADGYSPKVIPIPEQKPREWDSLTVGGPALNQGRP